jgi:hypothetical protein
MNKPLLSVVIPICNGRAYLDDSLPKFKAWLKNVDNELNSSTKAPPYGKMRFYA